jgi:hypothetical protein
MGAIAFGVIVGGALGMSEGQKIGSFSQGSFLCCTFSASLS